MQFLRQWLLGIVSCALLVSFCEQLTPAGALKKLMRFTGGLLLILSILQPVTRIDLDVLPLDLDTYRSAMAQVKLELEDERTDALADGIAARTGAYIEDKAEELGLTVRAVVESENVGGTPLPVSVTLYGTEDAALADYIESQLGIAKEKQVWKEEKSR